MPPLPTRPQHTRAPRRALRPALGPARASIEPLEGRLLCRILVNGEFVIAPPGGGVGHETIHMHPQEGVIGLNTAEAQSNGVVNWQKTGEIEI